MIDDIRIHQQPTPVLDKTEVPGKNAESTFAEIIKGAVENTESLEKTADLSIMNLLKGKDEIHETMIALQKADVNMRLMLAVRNKVIEAYKEIMHMQF